MAAQTSATLVDMENKSMKESLEDLQLSFDLTKARAYEFLVPSKMEGSLFEPGDKLHTFQAVTWWTG